MKHFITILALLAAATAFAEDRPATDQEASAALAKFRDLSAMRDESGWKMAIAEAAKCRHATVVFELSAYLKSDSEALRIATAEALGTMTGMDEPGKALVAAIAPNTARPTTLEAVLKAIGALGDVAAVPTIKADALSWFCDKGIDRGKALNAATEALGGIRCKASVDALIELRAKCAGGPGQGAAVRNAAATRITASLVKLTGVTALPKGDLAKWWGEISAKLNDDLTPVGGAAPAIKGMKR